jgi:hypothetical protein
MDLDEQTKNEAAKWRALVAALGVKAVEYEKKRAAWLTADTSGAYVHAEATANRAAHDIAGYVSLMLGMMP